MQVKSIAVFCGSKSGTNSLYVQHAKALGKLLAEKKIELIYGGGGRGLMGDIADAAMANGGKVTGIIPEILMEWEAHHKNITDLKVVADMHIRKKTMYELCDAAIILAGGNGTLDELFEMLTWNNLKIHDKRIILLNTAGFYDHLIAHIDHMSSEGFLYTDWKERLIVCDNPEEAISALV